MTQAVQPAPPPAAARHRAAAPAVPGAALPAPQRAQRGHAPAAQPAAGARRRRPAWSSPSCRPSSRCSRGRPTAGAADNTEQVVRVQEIQSSLLRADAIATNAFLVGGLEARQDPGRYDAAIDDVLRLIADAAEAQPADRAVLAELNTAVRDYATAVAQARDNNRQGFPVGVGYINVASQGLRETADPAVIVKALVDANSARADDELRGPTPALAASGWASSLWSRCSRQPADRRRFHRRVNVGLAVAAAAGHRGDPADRGARERRATPTMSDRGTAPTAIAVDEATARTAANDAKANESRGLINRGLGGDLRGLLRAAPRSSRQRLAARPCGSGTTTSTGARRGPHPRRRRRLGQGGALRRPGRRPTVALDKVDSRPPRGHRQPPRRPTTCARGGGAVAWVLMVLTLLGALVAAGAATGGINQRRREYS